MGGSGQQATRRISLALVHHDSGGAHGVDVPDLPDCVSAADMIPDATEALALWSQDQSPVEPRSVEDIRAEVAADLRDGASLIAVPHEPRPERRHA